MILPAINGPRSVIRTTAERPVFTLVTRTTDPNLAPYPERLYRPPAWAEFATGALAYLDTEFLEPADPAFEQLEGYITGH